MLSDLALAESEAGVDLVLIQISLLFAWQYLLSQKLTQFWPLDVVDVREAFGIAFLTAEPYTITVIKDRNY